MKSESPASRVKEVELKLSLPTHDPASLAKRLARTPVLARRAATQKQLHNIYFDTPEQTLHHERIALRLRRVGSAATPQWLQTLKTGGRVNSALSQRGEWESAVPDATLSLQALQATPWSDLDPDSRLFETLAPCFATTFERTLWVVRRRDGSVVEVALDIGQIEAGEQRAPICELELELLAGQPAALFEVAQQIARSIAVLPAHLSKAERGYALAQDELNGPLRARPETLRRDLPLPQAMQQVMREMFCQFTANLNALGSSDDPEVVHQARIGWRRFKSARRLFKPFLSHPGAPSWQALHPLLTCLGELRDLDVARTVTLPPLAQDYAAGDARRMQTWQDMMQVIEQASALQRKTVRYALQEPTIGAALLAATQWLEDIPVLDESLATKKKPQRHLRQWARRKMRHLFEQLQRAGKHTHQADLEHQVRILAKRMRYGTELLHPLLPKQRSQRWHQQASQLQMMLGTTRDACRAAELLTNLSIDRGLTEFLRGMAAGRKGQP